MKYNGGYTLASTARDIVFSFPKSTLSEKREYLVAELKRSDLDTVYTVEEIDNAIRESEKTF